jgi:hypothetical protein
MQNILYEEAKAKGWVRELGWYTVEFLSSDFILAALILCLELQFERDGEANVSETAETIDTDAASRVRAGSPEEGAQHMERCSGVFCRSMEGFPRLDYHTRSL